MKANNTKATPQRANGQKEIVNVWLNTHNSLSDEKKIEARNAVMAATGWSQSTFYKKMRNPLEVRDIEKPAIAKAYHKRLQLLFPETVKQAA